MMGIRWCRTLSEVSSAPQGPSTVITCEDVLLMKVVSDWLARDKVGVRGLLGYASDYLGITSPVAVYSMLRRLCEYGLVTLVRSRRCKSLDEYRKCMVHNLPCRIVNVKPTLPGALLAATSAIAYHTYLKLYLDYAMNSDKRGGEPSSYMNLIINAINNLFNTNIEGKDVIRAVEGAINAIMNVNPERLTKLATVTCLDDPFQTYAFRGMIYGGWDAGIILRFLIPRIISKYKNYTRKHGRAVTIGKYDVDELSKAFERGDINVIKSKWHIVEKLADPRIHCSF